MRWLQPLTTSLPPQTVTAVALDKAGSRLWTGSNDYTIKMYDFGGMNRSLKPFREFTPADGYVIRSLSFSPTGRYAVIATGSPKLKVYDREAKPVITTIRGDPYIRDMIHTVGHTAPNTCAEWHPKDNDVRLSCWCWWCWWCC